MLTLEEVRRRREAGLVWCDDPNCRAKEDPLWDDIDELRDALEHWRDHDVLSGCSHGR
jgi:hypothetical protein